MDRILFFSMIFIILSCITACTVNNDSHNDDEENLSYDYPDDTSNGRFFPKGVLGENEEADKFTYEWYSKHLIALEEPSLFQARKQKGIISYRFLYLRTFHNPISIRIELDKERKTGTLIYKKTDGKGGYRAGYIEDFKVIKLNENDIKKLLNTFETAYFWRQPIKIKDYGLDGAQWIIEGVDNGRYHLVDRWSPEDGNIYELGILFIELSGIKPDKIY